MSARRGDAVFIGSREYISKDSEQEVKSTGQRMERSDGPVIFDDTIEEKAWMSENEIVYWHYDHCSGKTGKGINLQSALYHNDQVSLPVAFEVASKPLQCCDLARAKLLIKAIQMAYQ